MHVLTLKFIFVIILFSFLNISIATTIVVNAPDGVVDATDGLCSISEAIINANDDATTHTDCPSGNGTDTIELNTNITLTTAYENIPTFGRNGTPAIDSTLILDGKGFTIQRDNSLTCDLNNAEQTGEFRILRATTNADLILQNISLSGGCIDRNGSMTETYSSQGGALLNIGILSIDRVTFKNNKAMYGGALYNNGTINSIKKSLFSNNIGDLEGGGISNIFNGSLITLIENSTFSANISFSKGGAILNQFTSITTIKNCTFNNNYAPTGGTIYNINSPAGINITNSIFNGNSPSDCGGNFSSLTGTNNLSTNVNGNCPGTVQTNAIKLDILADNGGSTLTHALLSGSVAIDTGDGNASNIDQRGYLTNGIRDIGAFEYNGVIPVELIFKNSFEN